MILSDSGAFSQIIRFPLGPRSQKPRSAGLTMIIDKGLGYGQLNDLFEVSSATIDILKFGFGTSCLYPRHILRQKLSLARAYSVHTLPGGTLGEIAISQNVFPAYVERCLKLGFTAIEVSNGTIPITQETKIHAIQIAKASIPLVISEVGKKLEPGIDVQAYAGEIVSDLEAGAQYVVIEGRETGENVGIYGDRGEIKVDILDMLIAELPASALDKIIWEAPQKSQQVALIQRFGQTLNLGNIPPADALSLECLRRGLRADTLTLSFTKADQ